MIHALLIDSMKALIGLTGSGILYISCFLLSGKQNKIQNRIEELWISIDERRRLSTPLALASKVAVLINHMLDHILRERLFSIRMVAN